MSLPVAVSKTHQTSGFIVTGRPMFRSVVVPQCGVDCMILLYAQLMPGDPVLVVQRFGVGLVIVRSLVRLPAGALSRQLGQLSLPSLRGR